VSNAWSFLESLTVNRASVQKPSRAVAEAVSRQSRVESGSLAKCVRRLLFPIAEPCCSFSVLWPGGRGKSRLTAPTGGAPADPATYIAACVLLGMVALGCVRSGSSGDAYRADGCCAR